MIEAIASSYSATFFTVFFGGAFIGALVATLVNGIFFYRRQENAMDELKVTDYRQNAELSYMRAEIDSLRQHIRSMSIEKGNIE
jgi:uncharacterized membrane protein YgaE (UPF0421/DUF939 family)